MNQALFWKLFLAFVVFVVGQIFLFRFLVLADMAFVFAYVGFLMLIPLETPQIPAMLYGFIIGLITDFFYDTLGIHAAAAVTVMYIRPFLIRFYTPLGGYDDVVDIGFKSMGWQWMLLYILSLTASLSLILFMLEAASFSFFHITILKAIVSSLLSTVFILLLYKVFFKES